MPGASHLFAGLAAALLALAPALAAPAAGIRDHWAPAVSARHALPWPQLQRLAGARPNDPQVARLLDPTLKRLLGARYAEFRSALGTAPALRLESTALVGEGTVAGTLGYRGAFFAFDRNGQVAAALKGGPHGTAIERFGATSLLAKGPLLHAWQEFAGIDE